MKKHLLPLLVLTCSYGTGFAQPSQGVSYFYPNDISARTVATIPEKGEFVMTETFHDSRGKDNKIRFVHYSPSTGPDIILDDIIIGHKEYDERNVNISYNKNKGAFFLVTYAQHYPSNGNSFVKVHLISPTGVLLLSRAFESKEPEYNSLIPLHGIYDPGKDQYVVVGTAVKHISDYSPIAPKVAFVATLDANLDVTNMVFYNSDPNLGVRTDCDMANKVIVDKASGYYYVTGSQNVDKNGRYAMGMRNMLIDPGSLMPTAPGWDIPLLITDSRSHENSVDMLPGIDPDKKKTFNVLANSTSNPTGKSKWHLYRIDPTTGLPLAVNIASTPFDYDSHGHSIKEGNKPNEIIVSGMKYRRYKDVCEKWDLEATPFMTSIDMVASWPGVFINHVEYNTYIGSQDYWKLGGFYSPANSGYPVPCYLNGFVDRDPRKEFSLAAPIKGAYSNLNTKYLRIDPSLKNGCDDIYCRYPLEAREKVEKAKTELKNIPAHWNRVETATETWKDEYKYEVCEKGYYRPGETGIAEAAGAEGIEIYPNPVTSEMTVVLGAAYEGRAVQVSLYDVVGKRLAVWHKGAGEGATLRLRLSDAVSPGVYMLQVTSDGHMGINKKIVVGR